MQLHGQRRRFCSDECKDAYYREQLVFFACEGCLRLGIAQRRDVSKRRFCSRSCYLIHIDHSVLTGPANGRWRGGKALAYGPGWKETKKRIRERDKVCRHCGKTPEENGRALDVHHIEPFRFSGDHSDDNLVALCRSCHMRADDHGRAGSARFLKSAGREKPPTKRQIRRSEAAARARRRADERSRNARRARELAASGWSLRAIALSLGVSHQTVANWLAAGDAPRYPGASAAR